ncbi:MAG: hypothetical protein KUA43_12240 [Hoeflea sp.]|uniref:hypothetical protein n=1 Tax=Hoeflea sp. TaxID=1940281 RepID=UPI001DFD2F37|nr:hypothetical protein [Hoeflea sp.]MBU4527781.1 hypothetical protein [Alphaproteobacteria bacterium]MBU4546184.1 hypothetical protein [Alphaproteobacteria bacterium]MBU4553131.1 hypothetical protein [Alphaproteobacteria bacterium]MBV1724203.1 hypothetical protein [Hoeflea sp.]MBV1759888.1 hypothetical protein [Hoeflea sp.]
MSIPGNAFLALWHDIEPSAWVDYTEWHTREHMPERLSIPGFTVGKRLVNHEVDRYRYGTIYAGDDLEVFRSPPYLERLNNPTPWSTSMQPAFRNFLRVACERLVSRGAGDGGAMVTVRLDFAEGGSEESLRGNCADLADEILKLEAVSGVHIGLSRDEVSGVRTRETELRLGMTEPGFDAVVLVEGSGKPELEASLGKIEAAIARSACKLANPKTIVYNLAYNLRNTDVKGAPS